MNKMLGMCFNWKVVAWLAVAGLGLFLVAPNLALAALPLLAVAACPISMLLMGRAMMGGHSAPTSNQHSSMTNSTVEQEDRADRLAQLRGQLQTLQEMEAALVKRIVELEESPSLAPSTKGGARGGGDGEGSCLKKAALKGYRDQ